MERFEYKVVPAPARGEKIKGAKTTPDRFAHALTALMNQMALDGWDYLRADTLPCEERVGFTGKTTRFQHMLVFRRRLGEVDRVPSDAPMTGGLVAAPPPRPQPSGIAAPVAPLPVSADGPRIGPAKTEASAPRSPIPLFGARRTGVSGAAHANGKDSEPQT